MSILRHSIRAAIVVGVVVFALSATAAAAESGSLTAEPMDPGASSTHTLTVTVGDRSAGQWTGLSVDYADSGANPDQASVAGVSTIGIDRGDDARGDTIDVDAADDLNDVSADSEGMLTFELGGGHSIEAGDEIVVRYIRGVQNPASAGDYRIPIDVNPSIGGGETEARLQIGSNRATVLVDDQTTTGEAITVSSVTLPNGGFVVLHEEEALGTGTENVDAITGESVVGTSGYLSAGSHDEVAVQLSTEIQEDTSYVAMTVKDGDGDESFDAEEDGPYTVRGNPIWESASFTIQEPTDTPTATATDVPTEEAGTSTATEMVDESESPTPTPASGPGFGGAVAVLAVLGTILGFGRHRGQ
jgi:PGF-CTERM protein